MAENLRFLLDLDNDVHYTESLVTLNSDRYIWYRLRRAGMDRNILFLRDGETGAPVFRVCDDDSRSRLLQFARRWILSNISETKKEYTPQDLNRSMDDLMAHLLKNKDEKWGDLFLTSMFLGMISAFLGMVFADVRSGIAGWIPIFVLLVSALTMAVCGILIKKCKMQWLETYAMSISMIVAMVFAVVITPILA